MERRDGGGKTKANYCMDVYDHGATGGNGTRMLTSVVNVGANGIGSVNNLNTRNSDAARKAMEVIYYATRSYMNGEPWGKGMGSSPWRFMMLLRSALYSYSMTREGLFSGGLPSSGYDLLPETFGSKWKPYAQEGLNYVSSTTNYQFSDNSRKDVQIMEEKDGYIFAGPYSIKNSGAGSITSISAISRNDNGRYSPDGWATSINTSAINRNYNLPNGTEFYLVFSSQKPDSIKEIKVTKKISNVLRARMVFCQSDGGQNIAIYGGKFIEDEDEITLPGVPFSNINLTKVDTDSRTGLANVGFIVYDKTSEKWLKDGTPAQYVDSRDDATVYITNAEGKVTIRNIKEKGEYVVYEIINPNFRIYRNKHR